MKIHALASYQHYADHLRAIHAWLPDELKGEVRVGRVNGRGLPADDLVMIAGHVDVDLAGGRRTVLVDHGAGQAYVDAAEWAQPYYGGKQPPNVIAYIGPRQECVDRYALPGVAVGAPICDKYDLFGEDDVVGFTWHWHGARICPETFSALRHYYDRFGEIFSALTAAGKTIIGHRHPRLTGYHNMYSKFDIPEVSYDELLRRCHTLIADNTTALYHAAYLCRDTVFLNAPWYRRDVEHGLRFWSDIPGRQIDNPEQLLERINSYRLGDYNGDVVARVWGRAASDGNDGLRAAAWLTGLASSL